MTSTTLEHPRPIEGEVNPDTGELFRGAAYDLPIPTKDGHRADTLKISVGGGIEVELMDEEALANFADLTLLKDVTFTVTATVVGNTWKASRNADDEETVVNAISLKVHSIDIGGQGNL